jgi:hypothetical protein
MSKNFVSPVRDEIVVNGIPVVKTGFNKKCLLFGHYRRLVPNGTEVFVFLTFATNISSLTGLCAITRKKTGVQREVSEIPIF